MKKPSLKFLCIMGFVMSFVLGVVMSVYMTLYHGAPLVPMELVINASLATVVGMVVCIGLPVVPLGAKFAIFYGAKPDSLLHKALQAVVINTVMTFCVSFVMTAYATGFATFPDGTSFIVRWLEPVPAIWGIAFIATLLTLPLAMTLALKAEGKRSPAHEVA